MSASGGNSDPKAANQPPDSVAPAGGNAVDGLTPPTMKYAADERTQIGPAPSNPNIAKPPSTAGNRGSSSPQTITGDLTGAPHTFATSVGAQDLSTERLLRDAPRIESGGHQCPSLNGIPLLAKIGQGGMGAVYYGVHPRLQSEVAVKVLPFHLAEQDPGMIKRFFREAQIAAMVRSPHLVNVMDVNEESGLFFLVMEFVPGKTAGQYLKLVLEQGQAGIPELEALDICIAATIGLQAAHNNNIVHRDLKPENIMVPYLSRNSANQFDLKRSKLMDLGLARNEESNQSLTGVQAAMGTPGYMAPEQALDAKTADKRSDIFGMGATMYALLTGKPPFRGEAIMKVLMATMHEPHEPVIKVRPEISQTFSDIIDKCLDKKQDNRFPDATQLLRALRHCRKQIAPVGEDDEDEGGGDVGVVPGMSVARQPAAGQGGQKTIIGGVGQPTLIGGEVQQKSKTGLYVAGAAAALILAGGLGYAFIGKKGEDPGKVVSNTMTATGTGTGVGKIEPPKVTMPAKVLDAQKTMHMNNIRLAEDSAKAGDIESANSFLGMAQSLPIKNISDTEVVKALDKEEKRVQGLIESSGKTLKFNEKLQLVDNFIKKEDLAGAKKELSAATEFAVEDTAMKTLQEKQSLLTFLQSAENKRKAFVEILTKSNEVLKDPKNVNDETMKALMDAQVKLPSDADLVKLRHDAPYLIPSVDEFSALQKKFAAILDERQKNDRYDKLLKQAKETTDLDKKASLLQEAIDLGLDRNEAKTAKVEVDKTLGDEVVKKREAARRAELKKDFDTAFNEARELNGKQDYEKALAAVGRALSKLPDDPLARKLESDLNAAILDKKNHTQFNNLLQIASGALDDGDTATAEKNVAEARKFFTKDPQLDKLDKAISDTKERIRRKKDYDSYAANARKAIGENDASRAKEFFDKAVAIDDKAPGLDGVRQFLIQKKAEQAAAQEKAENYKKYMEEASKFESVDGKPFEAQVADLKKALDSYTSAKLFAPDSDRSASEKLAATKLKLDTATAAWEREKTLAAQRAKFEGIKKEFDGKLADITKVGASKPAEAITALNALKNDMTDKEFFKAELAKIDGQVVEMNKVIQAQAEGLYKQAIQQVKEKLSAKELNGALTALRSVPQAYAGQQDVKDLSAALGTIQSVTNDIQTLVTRSNTRYTQLSNAIKTTKGDPEKARYTKSINAIQALSNDAMAKLVQSNLKDTNITSQLRKDKEFLTDDIGNALDRLDTISRERPEPVRQPPGETDINDRAQRRDPPPKKSSGGSVGEQDVDN